MNKTKGKPFLELFASSLQEDYRFPLLEFFAFLYALGTFAFANIGSIMPTASEEQSVYMLVTSITSFPILIFMILVFKNVAYGLGNDIEKGTIQTIFSYPLKRRAILTAKLLSAIGVALLVLFGIQIFALIILAPDMVLPYMGTVVLTYAANLSFPLLLASIILFATLLIRKGGLGIVLGIVIYFAISILQSIALFISMATRSALSLQMLAGFNPSIALQYHYGAFAAYLTGEIIWAPTIEEVLAYVGAGYLAVAIVLSLCYYFFSRRLNL